MKYRIKHTPKNVFYPQYSEDGKKWLYFYRGFYKDQWKCSFTCRADARAFILVEIEEAERLADDAAAKTMVKPMYHSYP